MRAALLLLAGALAGCNALGGPRSAAVPGAEVQPGLASCLASIGRADVAVDPDAPMSAAEIDALVGCTAERAGS
ncbi:hypothetical protein [Jannaschia marina]|uniref:hypothetical protein n=1 Tax=Jannaschia marina TaxID=2741674 RepID=UPI0015C974B1|nr:hypothetical protein [Jannaschia marina]